MKDIRFKINSIFQSIQGEGLFVGTPMNFIRFTKCNKFCSWCIGHKKGRRIPRIIMSNKQNKKIFDVKVGDKVLSMSKNGSLSETTVKKVFVREVSEHYEIKIQNKALLYFTGGHPLYTNDGWKPIEYLRVGDEIFYITSNEKMKFFAKQYNPMFNKEAIEKRLKNVDYKEIGKKGSKTRKKLFKENKLRPYLTVLKEKDPERYHEIIEMHSERMKIENPMKNQEVVEKVIKTNKLRGHYEKHSQRLKVKNPSKTKEFREYMQKNNPMKRKEIAMKNWISHQKRPTSIEKRITELSQIYSLPISYVGNGKFWVDGKNPDFVVDPIDETKKVIEVFDPTYLNRGREWMEERREHFKVNGYKCLILPINYKTQGNRLLVELRRFISNGLKVERIRTFERSIYPSHNPKPLKVYNFYCEPYNNYFVDYILVHNCDTNFKEGKEMTIEEILKKLNSNIEWVSLTGGEPMLEKNLIFLIKKLKEKEYKIFLETNGTKFDENVFFESDFISIDLKTPSSGNSFFEKRVFSYALKNQRKTQLKLVIQNENDIKFFKKFYEKNKKEKYKNWILQPEWSSRKKLKYNEIINSFPRVRIIPQVHKILNIK